MILVDTSVLVRYLRTAAGPIEQVLVSADCAICGVTRAEVLHGARTPREAQELQQAMDCLIQLPIPETIWDDMGHNLALLRAAGFPMPFQDVLLATVAISHNADLWSYDNHFTVIRRVLPHLRLFQGPP